MIIFTTKATRVNWIKLEYLHQQLPGAKWTAKKDRLKSAGRNFGLRPGRLRLKGSASKCKEERKRLDRVIKKCSQLCIPKCKPQLTSATCPPYQLTHYVTTTHLTPQERDTYEIFSSSLYVFLLLMLCWLVKALYLSFFLFLAALIVWVNSQKGREDM